MRGGSLKIHWFQQSRNFSILQYKIIFFLSRIYWLAVTILTICAYIDMVKQNYIPPLFNTCNNILLLIPLVFGIILWCWFMSWEMIGFCIVSNGKEIVFTRPLWTKTFPAQSIQQIILTDFYILVIDNSGDRKKIISFQSKPEKITRQKFFQSLAIPVEIR